MSDTQTTQQLPTDTMDAAAASIEANVYDLMGMEPGEPEAKAANRDETGKFKKPDGSDDDKAEKPETAEAAPEDDEDYIEEPPAKEGEQPTRRKLSEVLEGFKKAQALEAELADVKSKPIVLPQELDHALQQSVAAAQKHVAEIQRWQSQNVPQPPHPSYGNPNHPNYAPEAYAQAMQRYYADAENFQRVEAERQQIEANAARQMEAVTAARMQRHLAQIHEFWPEIKSKEVAQKVQTDLVQHFGKYGVTPEFIAQIDHPAFYALAKAALKGLASETVKEQAAKVVQAKPKLIKGQARQSTPSSSQARTQDAFKKLAQSGKSEDAYAVAESILF